MKSLEKVGQNEFKAVLHQAVADSANPFPPESYFGKKVRYKETDYTIEGFDKVTETYTMTSVLTVKRHELEVEKNKGTARADRQGKRSKARRLLGDTCLKVFKRQEV